MDAKASLADCAGHANDLALSPDRGRSVTSNSAISTGCESEIAVQFLQPAPELKKVVVAETPKFVPQDPALAYVLGVDLGVRSDRGGKGFFLAPRAHGKHNGIDFLAALGTPVLAACDGKAKSDTRGGYGHVVQLVCKLPNQLGGDEGLRRRAMRWPRTT